MMTATKTTTPQRLGLAIRDARQEAGLTQVQLAAKAGVSRAWLISIEAGSRRAEIGKILNTVRALGMALSLDHDVRETSPAREAVLKALGVSL